MKHMNVIFLILAKDVAHPQLKNENRQLKFDMLLFILF